jgi:hypothetical protein
VADGNGAPVEEPIRLSVEEAQVNIRIGITDSPRELEVELAEDTDRAALRSQVDAALLEGKGVLWLTDRRGNEIAVSAGRLAYVQLGSDSAKRSMGFQH